MTLGATSILGRDVDTVFAVIVAVCVVLLAAITALMVYFVFRYSRERNPHPTDIVGHTMLEITWTIVPIIIVMFMFYYGLTGYRERTEPPAGAVTVKATGQMWLWSFEYANGKTSEALNLPVNTPVKLILNSRDIIHSLYIPSFRIKQDAVPGMERVLTVTAEVPGVYNLFCTEYCGTGHSQMLAKANVMEADKFNEWFASKAEAAPQAGEPVKLDGSEIIKKRQCTTCHSVDGTKLIGPTFKGLFGRKEKVVTGGKEREVTVDEEYIRHSMLEPTADVVVGFPPVMPSQKGILSEDEIKAIIEYLKGLK